jgi:putative spermidine/putrescine transport system substrate-binding protein
MRRHGTPAPARRNRTGNPVMTRRSAIALGALALAPAALTRTAQAQENELVVGSWGGVWDETTQQYIVDPLVAETGAKVSIVPGSSMEQFAKLTASEDSPPFDVLWIDLNVAAPAAARGAFLPLSADEIPNLADAYENAVYFDGQAVAGSIGGISLVYDANALETVDSWTALWDEANACNISLSPLDGWAMHQLVIATKIFGDVEDANAITDLAPGFEATMEVAPNVYTLTGDFELRPFFERQEIVLGIMYSGEAYVMYTAGQDNIRLAKPAEGMVAVPNLLVIPKNARNPELAKKFIDYALAPDAQRGFAEAYASAPTNRTVELAPELADWMPYGEEEIGALITPDWTALLETQDMWAERWNKEIVPLIGENC